jgi:hypothetical protein
MKRDTKLPRYQYLIGAITVLNISTAFVFTADCKTGAKVSTLRFFLNP